MHMNNKKVKPGPKPNPTPKPQHRPQGTGSIRKLPDGRYEARLVTATYYVTDDKGNRQQKRKVKSRRYATHKAAEAGITKMRLEYERDCQGCNLTHNPTLVDVYNAWSADHEQQVTGDTMGCYKAAWTHLKAVHHVKMSDLGIDALQACIDHCSAGKRTRENIKALVNLLYKYAIPRGYTGSNINLGHFLRVNYDHSAEGIPRASLSDPELTAISKRAADGDIDAQDVMCLTYLGCRPAEFLSLRIENVRTKTTAAGDTYHYVIGGGKTAAGRDRTITISPKIWPYMHDRIGDRTTGYIFLGAHGGKRDLKRWTEHHFYAALERAGIDNPLVKAGGNTERHRITPHSCRHTWARLVKRIDAPTVDKLAIIGHTKREQLEYYIDSKPDELRRITDAI